MTLFTTNYSEVQENTGYTPLPQGEYEMVIKSVKENVTQKGSESMQFDLVVRNDLKAVPALAETNGKYADRHVFHDEWKRNKPAGYKYEQNNFMYYLKAAGVPEGTPINSLQDLFNLLIGKPVRVYVKKESNTHNGETKERNTCAPWSFKESEYKEVNHVYKEKNNAVPQTTNTTEEIVYGF